MGGALIYIISIGALALLVWHARDEKRWKQALREQHHDNERLTFFAAEHRQASIVSLQQKVEAENALKVITMQDEVKTARIDLLVLQVAELRGQLEQAQSELTGLKNKEQRVALPIPTRYISPSARRKQIERESEAGVDVFENRVRTNTAALEMA